MFLLNILQSDPIIILPWLAALLIGITVHEYGHGFAASLMGDKTAEQAGRLTLNPLAHLDVFGSLMLLLVGFGWAKPVPIDISRIRNGKTGLFFVSVAGIFMNLIFAVLAILLIKIILLDALPAGNILLFFFGFLIYINIALFVFNLLPIPPLDGYHIIEYFFSDFFSKFAPFVERYGFIVLLIVVFGTNLIGYLIQYAILAFSFLFNINLFALI